MNLKYLKSILVLGLFLFTAQIIQAHQIINFNRDWKFSKGNPANARLPEFNDAGYQIILL